MKYEILLFDADATLLDFKKAERTALIEIFNKYNIPSTEDILNRYIKINDNLWKLLEENKITKDALKIKRFSDLIDIYGFDCDANQIANDYIKGLSQKSYILEGATNLCKSLYGKCKMYFVTNGLKDVQQNRINKCDIIKYFDGVFISEEVGFEKPNKKFFEIVSKKIENFDKNKTIIIGDSLSSDIQGGINFGIDTLWYNPDHQPVPENKTITYIVDNLSKISETLGF